MLIFRDGHAATLEEQVFGPIAEPDEMKLALDDMIAKVKSIPGYRGLFKKANSRESISEFSRD